MGEPCPPLGGRGAAGAAGAGSERVRGARAAGTVLPGLPEPEGDA